MNFSDARDESLIAFYESVRRSRFEQTWSPAGAIVSSASRPGNMPTAFAMKWTDGRSSSRGSIGIAEQRHHMTKIKEGTIAKMAVVLEEVCRSLRMGARMKAESMSQQG